MPLEIYVSTDIEADGPIPGPHSMLSFASAAYQTDRTLAGTFSCNLETLARRAGGPKDGRLVANSAGGMGGMPCRRQTAGRSNERLPPLAQGAAG